MFSIRMVGARDFRIHAMLLVFVDGSIFIGLFFTFQVKSFFYILYSVLYCFWFPQIVHVAIRDAHHALSMYAFLLVHFIFAQLFMRQNADWILHFSFFFEFPHYFLQALCYNYVCYEACYSWIFFLLPIEFFGTPSGSLVFSLDFMVCYIPCH